MLAAGQLWGKSSAASLRPSPWKFSLFPSSARRSQEPEPSTVGSPRPYRGRESAPGAHLDDRMGRMLRLLRARATGGYLLTLRVILAAPGGPRETREAHSGSQHTQ